MSHLHPQKRIWRLLLPLSLGLLLITAVIIHPLTAQFATPTIDGVIGAGEYGNHTDGQNQQTSGTQIWYLTWDDTNLYVATDVANVFEGAVIYIDHNPITPINGGDNADGNVTGQEYDNVNFASLPFRADFVTYYKNGYREYRTADGSGGWSAATAGFGSYADDGTDTREIAIPWSSVTSSSRPAAFTFFAYAVSSGGFVYGQVPAANAGGTITTTARYAHYYGVSSTANGASTPPFSAPGSTVFINELDADTVGTDAEEFVELYDGGVGNTPLDGLALAAYNGSNDLTYNLGPFSSAIDLDGYTTNAEGYFTLGNTAVPGVDIVFNGNALQNGQDAVALFLADGADFPSGTAVTTTNLIDAIVYDTSDPDDPGLLVLLNTGQPQVDENGGGSGTTHANQRCPNGAGGLRNTDTYEQRPPTPDTANDCLPNLDITKTGPLLASAGETITYTINYGNNGVSDATAVVLTDTLPGDVTYVSDSSGLPCPACTLGATGPLTWSVGTVTSGSSDGFNLVVSVSPTIAFGAALTNTVTLTSPDGDADLSNNSDQWSTAVSLLDLAAGKSGPSVGFAGEMLVYTLALTNTGVATATDVILTDTLPLSLTYVADSAPWPALVSGNLITWAAGNVPANTLITFNLTATVAASVSNGTVITNTAVASTSATGDNPANNSAAWNSTLYAVVPIATARAGTNGDLFGVQGQVIYTPGTYNTNGWGLQDTSGGIAVFYSSPPTLSLGDAIRLVATRGAFNNEEQLGAPVYYFENLGAGPELLPTPFATGDVPGGASEGWLAVITGTVSNLSCPTGFNYSFDLDDGSGAAIVFVDGDTSIDVCANGLENGMTAVVTGFSTQFNTNYQVKPRRPADVTFFGDAPGISKAAPVQVAPGSLFTYTITVANTLGYTLTNVVITDAVPALATFAYALDGGIVGSGVVTWTLPGLANGSSLDVRFAVTATQQAALIENLYYAITADNFITPTFGTPVETLVVSGTLAIHDIQGARHFSLFDDEPVTGIEGVVTAVRSNGFYMQDPNPDNDDATSEAIFVFTGGTPGTVVGDLVSVDGTVNEFYPGGIGTGNLSTTEIENAVVAVLSNGHPLPAPITLGNGGRIPPNQIIDNDSPGDVNLTTNFDPDEDGIDFYESLEAMRVQVNDATVVGSTYFNETLVVADGGANSGIFNDRGALVVRPDDFNPERIMIDDALTPGVPDVQVGDVFDAPIIGVMDYNFGNFKLLNTTLLPPLNAGGLLPETADLASSSDQLTAATFNVENLDPDDDARLEALAEQIVENLQTPDIIALQEIQDNSGPVDDGTVAADETYNALIAAIINAGGPVYAFRDIAPENNADGGQPGGNIRVGFLFRPDRVTFVDRPGGTAVLTTTVSLGSHGVELSYSPGRITPQNDAFTDSRKPLAGEFIFNGYKLIIIANHFNSKGGDDYLFGRIQPPVLGSEVQRLAQAGAVHDFVVDILSLDPNANVIVLGDLNDFHFSPPLQALQDNILTNLIDILPEDERYTYIYEGNSQTLDHILVSDHLMTATAVAVDIVHLNAEFNIDTRPTDHDPIVSQFTMPALVAGFTSNSPVSLGTSSIFTNTTAGALAYQWDFGDGTGTSTAVNPTYIYTAVGTYTVVLTAANALGTDVITGTYVVNQAQSGYTVHLPIILKPPAAAEGHGDGSDFFHQRLLRSLFHILGQEFKAPPLLAENVDNSQGTQIAQVTLRVHRQLFKYGHRPTVSTAREHKLFGQFSEFNFPGHFMLLSL